MKEQETMTSKTNRHEQLGLTDGQVLDMYKYMVLARKFDERNLLLQRAGKINFHVSGIGQEACQVAAAFALDREKDYFLPYYRDYGFVMAVGMTPRAHAVGICQGGGSEQRRPANARAFREQAAAYRDRVQPGHNAGSTCGRHRAGC